MGMTVSKLPLGSNDSLIIRVAVRHCSLAFLPLGSYFHTSNVCSKRVLIHVSKVHPPKRTCRYKNYRNRVVRQLHTTKVGQKHMADAVWVP